MHPQTNTEAMPVYGVRPSKPGLYLGLFHGRNTADQAMHGWGFDGPAIGPLRYFHTIYACSVHVEFVSPTDAQLFTGTHDMLMDLQLNGDLLCFGGKLYGDWTVYWVSPEECHRPPDTFRQNDRPNNFRRQARLKEP
jgi:hypothetical protein